MKTYQITCKTNGYQASRNSMFSGVYCGGSTATVILKSGLTLEEAKDVLLQYYRDDRQNDHRSMYSGWASIMRHDHEAWNHGGLFGYEEDGYYYNIEEEVVEEIES